jgi:hypothetical protein
MKQILFNLALIDLNEFCAANGIKANGKDGSGSRLKYDGRFKYSLVTVSNGKVIASVQFHKSQVPTYSFPIAEPVRGGKSGANLHKDFAVTSLKSVLSNAAETLREFKCDDAAYYGKELAKIEKLMALQANCVFALQDLTVWLATFARGECRAHDVFESKRDAIAALTALNKFKIDRAKG